MTDLWEMLDVTGEYVILFSPRGRTNSSMEKFIQRYDPSFIRPTGRHKSQEDYEKEKEDMKSWF